jgi:PIN domain nuclease of toxin-antitoxin system
MKLNNIELRPVSLEHLEIVTTLPFHHRDPFDRLLIAQAIAEDIVIISADSAFSLYSVRRIWV